jgi:transglutaminase-like putative cysteine protease
VRRGRRAAPAAGRQALAATVAGLLALAALPAAAAAPQAWFHAEPLRGAGPLGVEPAQPDAARRERLREAGHGYVDLVWNTRIRLRADGDVESHTVLQRHFLSESGVASNGNLEVLVDAAREKLHLDAAFTQTRDGERVEVPHGTLQIGDAPHPFVFSDLKRVVVPYPGLSPGATAVLAFTRVHHTRAWPLPWGEILFFQSLAPIEAREVHVEWDEGVAAPRWLDDDPALTCERGERHVTCRRSAVEALPTDGAVASYFDVVPHLALSTATDWPVLARRIQELVEERARVTPTLQARADRLTAGALAPRDRLERLYRFVSDEIRYVAMEHGASAVIPRPAEQTLAQRYGDCKDKVTLLLALSSAAGLEAHAVLASFQRYELDRLLLPESAYFDHMIACVALPDEPELVCVDPTLTRAGLELPAELHGAVALSLRDGPQHPHTLPRGPYGWDIAVEERVEMGCDGSARRTTERRFAGPASFSLRAWLLAAPSDEQQRFFAQEYHDSVSLEVTPRFELRDLSEPNRPFALTSHVEERSGTTAAVSTGVVEHYDVDPWLITYARALLAENRVHTYRMPGLRYRAVQDYAPCAQQSVRFTGARLAFRSELGRLERHYDRSAPGVRIVTEFEAPARDFTPDELVTFRRFIATTLGQSQIWLSLE